MNVCFRTLPLAALLGLALVAGCDPKSPKVTADDRPPTGERVQGSGTITGSTGTATGTGGSGSTTTPGTPSGTLPEASGPALSGANGPTAGRSTGTPLGAGAGMATSGATPSDTHSSTAGESGRATAGPAAGAAAPPGVAVPAASAASMAAGANEDLSKGVPAAGSGRTAATPGGDAPANKARDSHETSPTSLSGRERMFVQTAAGLGLYEMAAAKLGQERAQDPAVKAFAQHLQQAHAKSQEQLQQLASQHRIDLPQQMPADRLTVLERLERNPSFDTAFVNTVGVQDHRSTIERFEKAARDAKDPELKGWIQTTLTSMREHLAQARKLPGANRR